MFTIEKLKDPEAVSIMSELINNRILETENRDWKACKQIVTSAAADTLGCRRANQAKKNAPSWTDEVKNEIKEKMRCSRRWMKRRISEDRLIRGGLK